MIAAVNSGWWQTYAECCQCFVSYDTVYTPNLENKQQYEKIFELYKQIYNNNQSFYKAHAKIFTN
ncbi:hypothetical protein [Spiroplasma clarkii]|uniref:hypothetical protein n=1 Tax=Spiroplasma clarkii TaxID=2139 RepID=UPI000C20FE9E|nr:hypothetical protein [Spiroplasma clarkii]